MSCNALWWLDFIQNRHFLNTYSSNIICVSVMDNSFQTICLKCTEQMPVMNLMHTHEGTQGWHNVILVLQEWTSHAPTNRMSCWDGEINLKSLGKKELWSTNIMVLGQKTVPTRLGSIENDISILHLKTSSFKFLHFTRTERQDWKFPPNFSPYMKFVSGNLFQELRTGSEEVTIVSQLLSERS